VLEHPEIGMLYLGGQAGSSQLESSEPGSGPPGPAA
jgi:hypothetical protein